ATFLVAPAALAQSKPQDAPGAEPPPPAQKMTAPTPAPELQELKPLLGTWKCDGKAGPQGNEMQARSTYKVGGEIDNFFIVGRNDAPKTKTSPAFHGVDYYGYDGKNFVLLGVDSFGSMFVLESKGWENGTTMNWAGKAHMLGATVDSKQIVTKVS